MPHGEIFVRLFLFIVCFVSVAVNGNGFAEIRRLGLNDCVNQILVSCKNFTDIPENLSAVVTKVARNSVCIKTESARNENRAVEMVFLRHDEDAVSRVEYEDRYTAVIMKRPRNFRFERHLSFKIATVGAFIFSDRIIVLQDNNMPLFEHGRMPMRGNTLQGILLRLLHQLLLLHL